jgi:hypothetical protein
MKRPVLIRIILYSAMVAITYWIVRLHLPNPGDRLDEDTVLAMHEYVVKQLGEKPLGEEIYAASKALEDKKLFDKPEFSYFSWTLPVAVVEPANLEDARSLTRQLSDNLSDLLSLAKEGIAFPSRESVKEWLESGEQESYERYDWLSGVSFSVFQNSAKALLIEADMYAKEGKWQEAFESFRDIDTLAHTVRYDWLIGHLIAMTLRGYEANGFERILSANPSAGADSKTLDVLKSTCGQHILSDRQTRMLEHLGLVLMECKYSRSVWGEFIGDVLTLSTLLYSEDFIRNPHNEKWMKGIEKRYGIQTASMDRFDATERLYTLFMVDWTMYPSLKKFLRRVGETEKELFERFPLVSALRERLSPSVRMRIVGYCYTPWEPNYYEAYIRSVVPAVRLELLRIAFAARLYYRDKNRFPEAVEELVPEYLERLPAFEYTEGFLPTTDLTTDPNRILSPIKITKVELDAHDICGVLGIRQKERWSEDRVNITPFGDLEWQNLSENVANVMAQYLGEFNKVMEGIAIKPAQDEKKSIVAKINAPQEFVAIYSPGPDGDDDGAMITYDPTNGTNSDGDIIVYPEGFAR